MQEHKIPGQGAPYFSPTSAPQPPAAVEVRDIGTKALVARLQEKLDATLAQAHESKTDIWRTERDDEMKMLKGTLSSTSGSVQTLAQQQAEQARQLRELFEQQAKQRPRRIRAPSGKIYEVID